MINSFASFDSFDLRCAYHNIFLSKYTDLSAVIDVLFCFFSLIFPYANLSTICEKAYI
jgi:hypothetical protein